jgi:hypothetical protein
MSHPFEALPIPRILWDSVEAVLTAQVHKLVKDIAETLEKPAKPLLDAIKKDRVTAYLWEDTGQEMLEMDSLRCTAVTRHPENVSILVPCSQPIVWGSLSRESHRCAEHMHVKEVNVSQSLIRLARIRVNETLYYLRDGREILNTRLEIVGWYNPDSGVATLFLREQV